MLFLLLHQAMERLRATSDTPRLDAEILLAFTLQQNRLQLIAAPNQVLTENQIAHFSQLIDERCQGTPVAYLTGSQEFWSLSFLVNHHTLIPRPETETLVEAVLGLYPPEQSIHVLDLGTGCGAIAIALEAQCPSWSILAVDSSPDALRVARQNAKKQNASRLIFLESNWFDNIPLQKFHVIVSNPPYLAQSDPHLARLCPHEPSTALVAGETGLEAFLHLISRAREYLLPNGWLLFEHGFHQGEAVRSLFATHSYRAIQTIRDLSGHERVTFATASYS